jgi:uncharacterized membrane-anchored protein
MAMSAGGLAARLGLFTLLLALASPALAQPNRKNKENDQDNPFASIGKEGPFDANLSNRATIKVPKNFIFVDQSNMAAFNQITRNPHNPNELGALISKEGWFVIFEFNEVGYIKDDEKDKIKSDADKILQQRKDGQEEGNKSRKAQGLAELEITGWALPPYYDEELKSLASAIRLRRKNEAGAESLNFQSHFLGRRGDMEAVLVCGIDQFDAVLPQYKKLAKGFSYVDGEKYSDFKSGDKVAEYGLYALAAGGGLALLAKSGILGKLLKPILVGVVVLFAAFGSLFKKIFGGKSKDTHSDGPSA